MPREALSLQTTHTGSLTGTLHTGDRIRELWSASRRLVQPPAPVAAQRGRDFSSARPASGRGCASHGPRSRGRVPAGYFARTKLTRCGELAPWNQPVTRWNMSYFAMAGTRVELCDEILGPWPDARVSTGLLAPGQRTTSDSLCLGRRLVCCAAGRLRNPGRHTPNRAGAEGTEVAATVQKLTESRCRARRADRHIIYEYTSQFRYYVTITTTRIYARIIYK